MAGVNYRLNFSWVIEGWLAGHSAPTSDRDLIWLKQQGILACVRLIEPDESNVTNFQITQQGLWHCHEPIPDSGAPTSEQINSVLQFIDSAKAAGRPVGVSCRAGLGRTGTILACYLVSGGCNAESAINEVRKKRPGSIETKVQEQAVHDFATSLG